MQHTKFAQSGNETLSRPVPKLLVGDHHTRLSALHRITFIGPLVLWEDFHDEVVNEIKNLRPKLEGIINHENLSKVPPYYMNQEHVQVGDEHGVQGHLINLNITKSIIENVLQSLQSHIEKQYVTLSLLWCFLISISISNHVQAS